MSFPFALREEWTSVSVAPEECWAVACLGRASWPAFGQAEFGTVAAWRTRDRQGSMALAQFEREKSDLRAAWYGW